MQTKSTPSAPPTAALVIEHVDPASLVPHPKNPRTITARARAALRRGIEQFGLVDPLVVQRSTRTVLGGHQRLDVAQELGHATVPVVWVDVEGAEADALLILLNNPNAQGEWDYSMLSDMMASLNVDDFDVTLTGFDAADISELMKEPSGGTAFPDKGDDIETQYECPSCAYKWSGKPK